MSDPTPVVDVGQLLPPDSIISVKSPEHPEDRIHRHRVEVLQVRFVLALLLVIVVFCMIRIFMTDSAPAWSQLNTALAAALGLLAGRALKS